jgi:hypothetical protein
MKKILFITICFLLTINSSAQSGYFGNKNGFSIKIDASPSLGRSSVLRKNNSQVRRRLRFAYTGYQINYTRILGRKVELSAGYGYNLARTVGSLTNDFDHVFNYTDLYIEDPRIGFHRANVDLNLFYSGSLAPLGNFIGLSFNYNFMAVDTNKYFYEEYSIGDAKENSSFYSKKYDLFSPADEFSTVNEKSYFSQIDLHLKVGNSYPLGKKMTLSYSLRIPIFTTAFKTMMTSATENLASELGFLGNNLGHKSIDWIARTTLRKYNRYGLELKLTRFF